MYEITIDWPTAETTARADVLELTVALSDEPDTHWTNACTVLAELREREIGRGAFYINTPSGAVLTIGGWDAGDEVRVKRTLNEFVAAVNLRAADDKRDSEARDRQKQAEAEALERASKDATERFRSD